MKPYLIVTQQGETCPIDGHIVWAYTPKGAIRRARKDSAATGARCHRLFVWVYEPSTSATSAKVWELTRTCYGLAFTSKEGGYFNIGPDGYMWRYGPDASELKSA